jgi:hypothetical protein
MMNRYLISALGAIVVLGVVNFVDSSHPIPSGDLIREVGLPFRFSREGGFPGTGILLWGGLVGDICAIALLAVMAGFVWGRAGGRPT